MTARTLCLALLICARLAGAQTAEWTYDLPAPAAAPTLYPDADAPDSVVIACGTQLIRLDGEGRPVWQVDCGGKIATPATLARLSGPGAPMGILVALHDGTVVAYAADADTAKPSFHWRREFGTPAGGFKSIVAADLVDRTGIELLVGFDDGWLTCIHESGEILWRFRGDRFRVGPPAVGDVDNDGIADIVYGTDNGNVYCLMGDGRMKWCYNEMAPYGRSGPNIADLDDDGKAEVLITRSNVGLDRCLMALDGATGAFRWRTRDVMQGYVSNAVTTFSDGVTHVFHTDKGNWLYCVKPDGTERWRTELGGRGIFWAPAAADIDGDGEIEAVVGVRGEDPETGACVFVVGEDGAVEASLDLGSSANAGPAVGDIDGDGELEAIVVTEGPDRVHALTWQKAGRVEWPSLRGGSGMRGATGIPVGRSSTPPRDLPPERGAAYWGANSTDVPLPEPAPEGAFAEVAVRTDAYAETRIVPIKAGITRASLPWRFVVEGAARLTIRYFANGLADGSILLDQTVSAESPAECGYDAVATVCEEAIELGASRGADPSGLRAALMQLDATRQEVKALEAGSPGSNGAQAVADAATQLRARAEALSARAGAFEDLWRTGDPGRFVWWQDANPWDPFVPSVTPESLEMDAAVEVKAFGDEFEDAALTLLNTGAEPIDVRCTFLKPELKQGWPPREPELARCITLRRSVKVPTALSDGVWDALPELDRSRCITLPPGEARQLWLVVDTNGLWPGAHELTLYLASLTKPLTVRAVPIRITVWPVALPREVFAKMNWSRVDMPVVSDQSVQDMIDHGISSVYGPSLPAVPVDAQGNLADDVDWARFDASLERIPRHFFLLWGGPPRRQWPDGVKPAEDSPEYFRGFQTAIAELAAHLRAKGIGYDRWAFYPIDEPWNTGFTHIPHLKHFCEMVKRADPNAQNYTDPAGLVRVEYIDEFKDLIDIWQPEMNTLKRDPKLVEWFRANARHFWAYEAPGPAKDFHPLGHYRVFAWLAWHFGCEGAGYWVYKGNDVWWPVTDGDWSAVYQTDNLVVPSRRWEADRDGVEDYRALYLLSQEIEFARQRGDAQAAAAAQALIDEAVEAIAGYNLRNIDEITRMTRDHEVDFGLFIEYKRRIAEAIMGLRAGRAAVNRE